MAEYIDIDYPLLFKDIRNREIRVTVRDLLKANHAECVLADVAPVRHGRWIWDEDGMDWNIGAWRCSECKAMSPMWWNADKTSPMHKSGHRYCPNCGAKMDKEKE